MYDMVMDELREKTLGSLLSEVANVLDNDIVVSEFAFRTFRQTSVGYI